MRHIDIAQLLGEIQQTVEGSAALQTVRKAHITFVKRDDHGRAKYYADRRYEKWKALKEQLVDRLGPKCWYSEARLIGAPLTIDHFRPQNSYWFLIFDSSNYRVACPFVNSGETNPLYGCAGGKGNEFPLLDERVRATGKKATKAERPLLLDPCDKDDCERLSFEADGRPVVSPAFEGNELAEKKVEISKIVLNLDHPAFNTEREQLYFDVKGKVDEYNDTATSQRTRDRLAEDLRAMIGKTAAFSSAARQYLKMFRDSDWVELLLQE